MRRIFALSRHVLAAALLLLAGCSARANPIPGAIVVKEPTQIAGINLLGIPRLHDGACAPPEFAIPTPPGLAEPDDADSAVPPPTPPSSSDAPEPPGPAGAHRVVVVGDSLLDGLCALDLGERVVGRIAQRAGEDAPNYLGRAVAGLPALGFVGAVPVDKLRELHPDLILARPDLVGALGADLGSVAPVVAPQQLGWKGQFLGLGALFGREAQARTILDGYERFAAEQRQDDALDPGHTRASLVRFDGAKITLEGPESFAGSVLADVGVDRPPAQAAGAERVITADQLAEAEGDLIYVSFGQPVSFGEGVVSSDAWLQLGAAREKVVFAVYDQWWHRGAGPIAARDVIIDVAGSLNTPPPP